MKFCELIESNTKNVVGSGDWVVSWEKGKFGNLTFNHYKFRSARKAREFAAEKSVETGGYVTVNRKGIEHASYYRGEEAS